MDLQIRDYIIDGDLGHILNKIRYESKYTKLKTIRKSGENYLVTCPFHKDGQEAKPACYVYCGGGDIEFGTAHCFACGASHRLPYLVAICLDLSEEEAEDWLISNFGCLASELRKIPPKIEQSVGSTYLDENILESFEPYCEYLNFRHLDREVCERFKVKFDPISNSVVFPVHDKNGNLKYLTRRSVETKSFKIDGNASKSDIYLLNYVEELDCKTVIVCESQINALTCWQQGFPAIALLGSGTPMEQLDTLNKSSVYTWILAYDNDNAGRHGADRFKRGIRKDMFVEDVLLPPGKDVNDLTTEEFHNIFDKYF